MVQTDGRIAYCVKCKDKTAMKDCAVVTMKNGRSAVKGKCSACGTGMYSILSTKDAEALKSGE